MKWTCLVYLILLNTLHAGDIHWNETRNWRLYAIHGKGAFNYPLEKLADSRSTLLDNGSMKIFLSDVSPIPSEKTPVWMGAYIASCELKDGTSRKIVISVYGGFFYDDRDKIYYQLPVSIRKQWLEFFADHSAALDLQEGK